MYFTTYSEVNQKVSSFILHSNQNGSRNYICIFSLAHEPLQNDSGVRPIFISLLPPPSRQPASPLYCYRCSQTQSVSEERQTRKEKGTSFSSPGPFVNVWNGLTMESQHPGPGHEEERPGRVAAVRATESNKQPVTRPCWGHDSEHSAFITTRGPALCQPERGKKKKARVGIVTLALLFNSFQRQRT